MSVILLRCAAQIAFTLLVCIAIPVSANAENWRIDNLPNELQGQFDPNQYADVYDAANSLVHFLENAGYPLATVSVNEKTLSVNLGSVERISIQGVGDKTAEIARSYLQQLIGEAPHIDTIDHVSGLIQDIPGLSANLQFIRVSENNTYEALLAGSEIRQSGSLSLHNTPTEDFSGREVVLHQEFYSLLTGSDILRFELAGAQQGSESLSHFSEISYQAPINNIGSFAEARFSYFDSASDFNFKNQSSVDTRSIAGAVMMGHRFKRTVNIAQTGFIEFDYRVDDDDFSDRRENGVMRTSWFYKNDTDHGDTYSYGLTVSGGRSFHDTKDSFGSLRGGLGIINWLPQISDQTEILIELSGQLGSDDQPEFELFSFGGQNKQRGFAPFEYAGSSGANLTLELGQTVYFESKHLTGVTPYIFVDASFIDNRADEVSSGRPDHNELASSGVGVRATFESGFSVHSWIATPLHDGQMSDRSHNPEFYLQAQYSW